MVMTSRDTFFYKVFCLYFLSLRLIKGSASSNSSCQSGWNRYGNYCYRYFDDTKTWYSAWESCVNKSAKLLSISSQNEQTFLDNNRLVKTEGWIGMTDDATGDKWTWTDGSTTSSTSFANWDFDTGKPNNRNSDEKCAVLGINGRWFPQNCDTKNGIICKMPAQLDKFQMCEPGGWKRRGKDCYLFVKTVVKWKWAKIFCGQVPTRNLTSILSYNENYFLVRERPNSAAYWIGLQETGKYKRSFRWIDGTKVKFQNWAHKEPNNVNWQTEHCVAINNNGKWNDVSCMNKMPYLCKQEADVNECEDNSHNCSVLASCVNTHGSYYCQCNAGYVKNGTICQDFNECSSQGSHNCPSYTTCVNTVGAYKCICNNGNEKLCAGYAFNYSSCERRSYNHGNYCYQYFYTLKTWRAARKYCALNDADLLSIGSQSEQTFLDNNHVVKSSSWIGMHDDKTGSKWEWSDGSTTRYQNWDTEKYRNRTSDAKCAVLGIDGKWTPQKCNQIYEFICKVDENFVATPGKCNQGWKQKNDYCYWFVPKPTTFEKAKDFCEYITPTKLTNIQNSDYNNFLVNSRPKSNSYWIGLKDVGTQPRKFRWVDGTESQFQNWADNEPNNANYQTEHCAQIGTDGKWNDINCHRTFPFVCKKKEDVDECKENNHNCGDMESCVNIYGHYYCECKDGYGYVTNGTVCLDVNECTAVTHSCGIREKCINTQGSYYCDCKDGYVRNGQSCEDINECSNSGSNNCSSLARCVNNDGSYECICNSGYSGDGITCSDVDECTDKSHSCHPFAKCSNTVGYFTCKCNTGYSGDGRSCLDVDECAATHSCHSDATCLNNQGSYKCQCRTGYSGNGRNCVDINECQSDPNSCHQNATCVNSNGSYTCTCKTGFTGDGKVTCKNKDDCVLQPCLNGGVCVDGINSYRCSCKDGYDGQHCENEKDECASNPCQNNGQCYDFVNQFRCICNAGYIGKTCQNECANGTYGYDCLGTCNCDNANTDSLTCNKVTGACSCKPGYYGNLCNKACDNGRYGPKCSLTCLCKNGSVCYHVTGHCTCATGYTGQYCGSVISQTDAPEPTEQPEPPSQ